MRVVASLLLLLAMLAAAGAIAAGSSIPDAVAQFAHEPEDVYLLVLWSALLSFLAFFWLCGAIALFRPAVDQASRFIRGLAWGVVLVGCVLFVVAVTGVLVLDLEGGVLGTMLGSLCVVSAIVVLKWRRGVVPR